MTSPVRRTTIVVSDLEKSLAFYRDTLELEVWYDEQMSAEATGKLLGVPNARVRLVSLQGDKSVVGMVGLLHFISPPVKPRAQVQRSVWGVPDVALIFSTDDIHSVSDKLQKAGIRIQCPPIEYEIPGRGRAVGLSCYDPDGILVEFTQFGPLKGKQDARRPDPETR